MTQHKEQVEQQGRAEHAEHQTLCIKSHISDNMKTMMAGLAAMTLIILTTTLVTSRATREVCAKTNNNSMGARTEVTESKENNITPTINHFLKHIDTPKKLIKNPLNITKTFASETGP